MLIVVKFKAKPRWSERCLELARPFTEATHREPGNLWFDWSRSTDDPNEFVLVEALQNDVVGAPVNSDQFKAAMLTMPEALVETAKIVSQTVDRAAGPRWVSSASCSQPATAYSLPSQLY